MFVGHIDYLTMIQRRLIETAVKQARRNGAAVIIYNPRPRKG